MIRSYRFCGENPILFDDSKSVRDLIAYAFDQFGYYEPAGMDIVTVFQSHSSKSSTGWFTTDTSRRCSEEIENLECLSFGYNKPGWFYFAEGGWGRHMKELGNHPELKKPVSLHLNFGEFSNAVVINGTCSFRDVIDYLKRIGYISKNINSMKVLAVGTPLPNSCRIDLTIEVLDVKLTDFDEVVEKIVEQRLPLIRQSTIDHLVICLNDEM